MPLVAEPETDTHGETVLVGFVEDLAESLGTPGADRVATERGELGQLALSARATNEIGPAVAEHLKAATRFLDGHAGWSGYCRKGTCRQCRHEQEHTNSCKSNKHVASLSGTEH
jgi:hypothetical protein